MDLPDVPAMPEPPRSPALHQCRCLILPSNRCMAPTPMDQPVCDDCEVSHFGEKRVENGTIVPLPRGGLG